MKFYPIANLGKPFAQSVNPQDLPGVLFERTANMEGLQKEFSKLLLLPKKKKEKWIKSHEEFIQDMLQKIKNESTMMIHEFAFNEVARRTVTEYMVVVQQTLSTLEKIVYDSEQTKLD